VQAQQKYQKQVQQGTQQRSCVRTMEAIDKIHNGLIGRAYFAKGWYSNTRKSIGIGKACPCRHSLTGICGRDLRHAGRTWITFILITGTGLNTGVQAKH